MAGWVACKLVAISVSVKTSTRVPRRQYKPRARLCLSYMYMYSVHTARHVGGGRESFTFCLDLATTSFVAQRCHGRKVPTVVRVEGRGSEGGADEVRPMRGLHLAVALQAALHDAYALHGTSS